MADGENEEVDFGSADFEAAVQEARDRASASKEETLNASADTPKPSGEGSEPAKPADEPAKPAGGGATKVYDTDYFKTTSEGLINSEDEFKAALTKVKNYDSLETKLKDTEAKVPQFKNPETEALFNLWASGDKQSVLNYIRETEKDYKTMSDLDIMRTALKGDNPQWDERRIDLELRHKYGTNLEKINLEEIDKELNPDDYKDAVAHNKEVEKNLELLQMHAFDNRVALIDKQSKIQLPEIKKADAPAPTGQPTEAELAAAAEKWVKNVEETMPKLANIKMTIDNKEVEYVSTDDDRKALTEKVKNFKLLDWAKSRWYNEDGTPNPVKLAEDMRWLEERENIITSFSSQVKTDTTKNVIKQIKNIDDNNAPVDSLEAFDSLEDAVWAARDKARAKRKAAQE